MTGACLAEKVVMLMIGASFLIEDAEKNDIQEEKEEKETKGQRREGMD
jgi:hypothetical protein